MAGDLLLTNTSQRDGNVRVWTRKADLRFLLRGLRVTYTFKPPILYKVSRLRLREKESLSLAYEPHHFHLFPLARFLNLFIRLRVSLAIVCWEFLFQTVHWLFLLVDGMSDDILFQA